DLPFDLPFDREVLVAGQLAFDVDRLSDVDDLVHHVRPLGKRLHPWQSKASKTTARRGADYTPRMRALRGGLLLLSSLLAAGSQAAKNPTVKEWLDGPVRYIATPEEIKEFKRLKDDRDRASFIEQFWRKRDPSPETLTNEYRQLFRERGKEANDKFLDSAAPGWKTDRGKIYILHGPPEEVREDPNMRTESGDTAGSGLIRWTYGRPAGQPGLDPFVYFAFVRNPSGEYKLSYDPVLASPFFDWNDDSTRLAGVGDFLSLMCQRSSRSPLDA